MSAALPFQEATIRAAWRALVDPLGTRRFLVADEVGLGKTIVAQGVIERLLDGRADPLRVFYVCNNLAIAHQNREKLLDVLEEHEREGAICEVDRLSLLPGRQPTHPRLRIFSLTPQTSMPRRKGQPRKGRWHERALLRHIAAPVLPRVFASDWNSDDNLFNFGVTNWSSKLDECRAHAELIGGTNWFERALRLEFLRGPTNPGDLDAAVLRLLHSEQDRKGDPRAELMGRMRNALAALALLEIKPDLVIFDEFQRFADLLAPPVDTNDDGDEDGDDASEAAARVLGLLRGDQGEHRPKLLLLSATPYRLVTARHEDADGGGHHADFFAILEFLAGHGAAGATARTQAQAAFRDYRSHLERLDVESDGARDARARLTQLLSRYIARTERASFEGASDPDTRAISDPVEPPDLRVFKHFARCLQDGTGSRAADVAFWSSIPMPIQTMGSTYTTWERAGRTAPPDGVRMTARLKREFRPPNPWPHPGLRALLREVPAEGLLLPWVAPSAPWWPLAGPWAKAEAHKWLIFSRFRAVPPTIAAALSLEAEHLAVGDHAGDLRRDAERSPGRGAAAYADAAARLPNEMQFQATKNVVALFVPWPTLARWGDPRVTPGLPYEGVHRAVAARIRATLTADGVNVSDARREPREPWELLVGVSPEPWVIPALERLAGAESGLAEVLAEWRSTAPVRQISPAEIDILATWALTAPGIVFGRALTRHVLSALEPVVGLHDRGFSATLDLAWRALRTYIDRPWFLRRHRVSGSFLDVARNLVRDGNLESVLDEHLWILRKVRSTKPAALYEALDRALGVRAGEAHFRHAAPATDDVVILRAHAALPFAAARDAADGSKGYRPDDLRDAFNSPFWPHVLCTTSVGQEGLDFHLWCRRLLHWDLPTNPVDLEQREGRIRRFGGLAVREQMAARALADGGEPPTPGCPWDAIAKNAADSVADPTGLQPWWSFPGADVERRFVNIPFSRRESERHRLQGQRWVYRVVLGQPHQEDLMGPLAAGLTHDQLRAAAVDLCPMNHERKTGD